MRRQFLAILSLFNKERAEFLPMSVFAAVQKLICPQNVLLEVQDTF